MSTRIFIITVTFLVAFTIFSAYRAVTSPETTRLYDLFDRQIEKWVDQWEESLEK